MTKLLWSCVVITLVIKGTSSLSHWKDQFDGRSKRIVPVVVKRDYVRNGGLIVARALRKRRREKNPEKSPKFSKSEKSPKLSKSEKVSKSKSNSKEEPPVEPGAGEPFISTLDDVTPGIVLREGNTNGYFNTCRNPEIGVEVGLRARLQFQDDCTPLDCATDNSTCNADGTYSFDAQNSCNNTASAANCGWSTLDPAIDVDVGIALSCAGTPRWNFDWAVNVDYRNMSENVLSDFAYELGVDCDPGDETEFQAFDPISLTPYQVSTVPVIDYTFSTNDPSTNATMQDFSPTAGTADEIAQEYIDEYLRLLDENDVVQNTENIRFLQQFPGSCLSSFDPSEDGHYVLYMCVKEKGETEENICCVTIQVLVGDSEPLSMFTSGAAPI